MSRRFWLGIALLALVGLGLFYFVSGRRSSAPAQELETVTVSKGTLVATVSASGQVVAAEDRNLFFSTSGQVAEVLVEEGEQVEEGQTLAILDTADLELQIEQAQATWAQARARLAEVKKGPSADDMAVAEAQLELARINLQQAQSAWDVVKWQSNASMLPQGVALQQATIEYEQALANYNLTVEGPSAEEIAQAQAEVDRAAAALQQIQLQLDRSQLFAPFSATVAEVMIQEGETVSPGSPALRIVDLTQLWVELDLDEVDIGEIQIGQEVMVTLDALPEAELSGAVDFISPAATIEGGAVTYTVRVILNDLDPRLRVGMTADADIETQRIEGALLVPNRAVIVDRETGKFYVEKVTLSGSELIEISPGARNETYTQVLAGLAEVEEIIIRPVSGRNIFGGTFSLGGGD
ncbi:MAG: efflux RND transporter periplasmic adaptor subunit [Chloroflexi bacterium]|nr:efflux RND transporter periplasmic adaptor subunit [Chloroflexota bacterium]